ncbi:MAG: hypothetical protein JKX84_05820 [Flavobacteriales bacterium]|nr:hypothetical protein [Flavobacteriales bacterium]
MRNQDRFDICLLTNIEFNGNIADGGIIRCGANKLLFEKDNQFIEQQKARFREITKNYIDKGIDEPIWSNWLNESQPVSDVNIKRRVINFSRICDEPNQTEACKKQIVRGLDQYVQDRFHIRTCQETVCINTANAEDGYGSPFLAKFFSQVCTNCQSEPDRLGGIAGGNMFVSGDIVFMGRDELHRLKRSELRRQTLGAKSDSDIDIETAILDAVYDRPGIGKLIWVGTELPRQRYNGSSLYSGDWFQPSYHIDLFFHPLGIRNGNEFVYIFGIPPVHTWSDNPKVDAAYALLRQWLIDTKEELKKNLPKNYVVEEIEIPTPILIRYLEEGPTVVDWSSAVNGISENLPNDRINYLFPFSTNYAAKFQGFETTQDAAISLILAAGITVDTVKHIYEPRTGLHCRVKVLSRK